MPSLEELNEKWKRGVGKLENEMELFRIHFILTKKCKCKWRWSVCSHFRKERDRIFGERINKLTKMRILIGISADRELMSSKI